MPVPMPDGFVIQNISFADGMIQISYSEPHDISDSIGVVKTLMFEATEAPVQVAELFEAVTDLIDVVMDRLRNPVTKKAGRRAPVQ